jgi:hypothetical protein
LVRVRQSGAVAVTVAVDLCDEVGDDVAVGSEASAEELPERLTLWEAYQAAFHLVDKYISMETQPDVGLVLLWQYLKSDPARWSDWREAVARAVNGPPATGPFIES